MRGSGKTSNFEITYRNIKSAADGSRWIRQLFSETKRYGELCKAIPAITEKMLIQTLKELVADEIITRKAMPVVPPHVEYSLADSGQELSPVISEMVKWAFKYNTQ